jgi:chromosome segregation ATPase
VEDEYTRIVSKIEQSVTKLEQDMSVLTQDVSELKQDVSELKQDVSGLKQDVSELKQDVSGLKQDVSGLKQDVSGLRLGMSNIERLIIDLKESLERQIEALRNEMRDGFARVDACYDTQQSRVEKHGSLLQTGSRWSNRMLTWSEKVDSNLAKKDDDIADIRHRLRRLEDKS